MRLNIFARVFFRRDSDPHQSAASISRYPGRRVRIRTVALVFSLLASAPVSAVDAIYFTPNPHPHTVVVDWVEAMLLAIQQNPPAPTATTWRMLVATTSMYNAWSAYDEKSLSVTDGIALKRDNWEHTESNKEIAVSHAAYHTLSYLFPNQKYIFDEVMELHGMTPSDSTDITTPEGVGKVAAQRVIDARLKDGSNAQNGFKQVTSNYYPELYTPANSADPQSPKSRGNPEWSPNRWTPLRVPNGTLIDENGNPYYVDENPGTYSDQAFLTPHWGAITPYALTSGDQFRPPGPPHLGSNEPYTDALGNETTNDDAYRSQAQQVLNFSADLTDEHKIIAEFWADGPGTWTPPGHWMQLANGISIRDNHSIGEDVRMYMALAGAVFDAGIVAWEAKRAYDFIRPASAIPYLYQGQQVLAWGGPDQGAQIINGEEWRPYQQSTFVTPPFAEFTSGHSTFSAAAAYTLAAFTGSDALYDGFTTIGRDYDEDGVEDLLGQHLAMPGSMVFEEGPAVPVVLRWDTFTAAAEEAGISRLYGGIHFQDGNLRGQESGQKVGMQAYQLSELYWDPFGEIIRTVEEFAAAGQIGTFSAARLTNFSESAQVALSRRNPQQVCARIRSIDNTVFRVYNPIRGRKDFSKEVAQHLNQQFKQVADLLCSGDRSPRLPRQRR